MTTTTHRTPAEVAAATDFGSASARKTGRNPAWPYVPVVLEPADDAGRTFQRQIRARAFATRAEAVAYAERHIAQRRRDLEAKLADPRYRALRSFHGLPAEMDRCVCPIHDEPTMTGTDRCWECVLADERAQDEAAEARAERNVRTTAEASAGGSDQ